MSLFRTNFISGLILIASTTCNSVLAESCIAYLKYTGGYWQVWMMDQTGQHQQQLSQSTYDKSSLSWYPDSQSLLINSNDGNLYKLDTATGTETKLNINMKGMFDAVLSPNGKYVSFGLSTSGSRDDHNIWIVNLNNNNAKKLTNLRLMQHLPTWSADSQSIYFSSKTDDQHNDIMRVTIDKSKTEYITSGALYNFDATASSNYEIVLSSNRSGNYELWHMSDKETDKDNYSDSGAKQLTHRSSRDAKPSWSINAESIAFESSEGGQLNIWKMNADGSLLTQLTHDTSGARFPVWAPQQRQGLCD